MNSVYEKSKSSFQVALWVLFILVILITLLPILHIFAISLSGKEAIMRGDVGIFPTDFTTEAYSMVFRNSGIVNSLFFSIFLTVVSSLLSIGATILAAYPLSKSYLKGKTFFMTLITVTMYVGAGMVPDYLLFKELHMLNTIWVLIFPGLISAFNLIILRTFFAGINNALFEAAYIDGCSEWKCLFKIAIPLSLPSVFTLMLFYAVARWNNVSDVLFYINKAPLYTLQYQLKLMLDTINLPYEYGAIVQQLTPENVKASTVVFSMIPMLIVYPFVQKYFTKGVMIGGVKE
ncbi:MAG: carbohydrate ABC transporter permease [Christensenella sp.]